MGHTVKDTGAGERGHLDIGKFLPLHSEGCSNLRRRDLGCEPMYRAYFGEFSPHCGMLDPNQATQVEVGKDL